MSENEFQMDKKEGDQITLQELISLFMKKKRLVFYGTLIFTLISLALSLILPPVYQAETKFYPPTQNGMSAAGQILSQFSGASPILGGFLNMNSPAEIYIELLQSRPVMEKVIEEFDLMKRYGTTYRVDARKKLKKKMTVSLDKKSNVITLSLKDRDPKIAAEMANFFIDELRNFSKGFALSDASQRRIFFEEQLAGAKEQLKRSEDKMSGFQKRTGALNLEDQSKVVIQAIGDLKAQIAEKEVQLKVMEMYTTPRNPDFKKLKETLNGLKAELRSLETEKNSSSDPFLPVSGMPDLGTEYGRNLRDLKFAEAVYELMLKQYETAKIEEAKEPLLIQVIEKAIPPEKRTFPKRASMTLIGAFVGFFLSAFAVLVIKAVEMLHIGDNAVSGKLPG